MTRAFFVAVALVLVGAGTLGAQSTARQLDATYRFTVAGAPVRAGSLLLYSREKQFGMPDPRVEIGRIANGVAPIHVDSTMLDRLKSRGSQGSYFVALHVDGLAWFKTPDFPEPLANTLPALKQLGALSTTATDSVTVIDVPPPVTQTIRAVDDHGLPVAGLEMKLHTFLSIAGRCGLPTTFGEFGYDAEDDSHTLLTDVDGRAAFIAPLTKLMLRVETYEVTDPADGTPWLTPRRDIELPASTTHTVRIRARSPDRSYVIRLLTPDGMPIANATLVRNEATGLGCGVASDGPVGVTAANGEVLATFALEHTDYLWFELVPAGLSYRGMSDEARALSETERLELFRTGTVTIRWAPPRKAQTAR